MGRAHLAPLALTTRLVLKRILIPGPVTVAVVEGLAVAVAAAVVVVGVALDLTTVLDHITDPVLTMAVAAEAGAHGRTALLLEEWVAAPLVLAAATLSIPPPL